jgi:chaperone required for assembly of F1-ATPase
VCIYLSRVLLSISPATELDCNLEPLVSEVICHLSFIRLGNALFKATTWSAFIAGAETKNPGQQAWVVARLREIWEVEPWGLIRGALGILELIWHRRNTSMQVGASTVDWIQDLRTLGVDWLIV